MKLFELSFKLTLIAAVQLASTSAWRQQYESPDEMEFLSNFHRPSDNYNPFDFSDNREENAISMEKRGPISDPNDEEELSTEDMRDIFSNKKKKQIEKKELINPSPYENNEYFVGSLAANKKKRNVGLFDDYLKSALQSDKVTIKKKRSTDDLLMQEKMDSSSDSASEKMASEKMDELLMIERMSLLEAENAYLKEALDSATRAQVLGNDRSDLNREIQTLSAAEKVSEMIENMDKDVKIANDVQKESSLDSSELEDSFEERRRRRKRFEMRKRNVMKKRQNERELQQCAAVEELMDGCSAMSFKFGLTLDSEAKLACDTHKLCYACGGPAAYEDCDTLYEAEVFVMCSEENDRQLCLEQAAAFLTAMQGEHDTENQRLSSEICQLPCVKAFL